MRLIKAVILITLFSSVSMLARKGDWVIAFGPQYAKHTDSFKDAYENGYGINFTLGRFVAENLLVGGHYQGNYFPGKEPVGIWYDEDTQKAYIGKNENWAMNHDLEAFLRYYFWDNSTKITPYIGVEGGLSFLYESIRIKDASNNQLAELSAHNLLYSVAPVIGVSFPLSKSVSINLSFKHTWTWTNESTGNALDPNRREISTFSNFQHFDSQLTFNFAL